MIQKTKINKGITLISLVLTIIILLILVGITLYSILGENGILLKSQKAGQEYKMSEKIEELQIKIVDLQVEIYNKENRNAELEDLAAYLKEQNYEMIITNDGKSYGKVNYEGYEFIIDEQLKIINVTYLGGNSSDKNEQEEIISKLLLSVGEDSNKTLDEILQDGILLDKIFNTDTAIEIVIENKEQFLEVFINNSDIMNKIANSEKMMDKIVNNSEWSNAILNNTEAVKALDDSNPITVPNMTSYTSPKGQVIYSSEYSYLHLAYNPFAGIKDWESSYTGMPQYIGYMFEEPVWVYKCYILNSNDTPPTEMTLQKSDDGENWTNVFDDFTYVGAEQEATDIINSNQNVGRAKYWRLYITKSMNMVGVDLWKIQFYGK